MGNGTAPETRWQQSYDTTLADVFEVQSAVAARVADNLGVVLSPPARNQLAVAPTQNLARVRLVFAKRLAHSDTTRRPCAAPSRLASRQWHSTRRS